MAFNMKDFNDRLDRREPKAMATLQNLGRLYLHGTPGQRHSAGLSLRSIAAHRKMTARKTVTVGGFGAGMGAHLGTALAKVKHFAVAPFSWTLHTSGKLLNGAGNVLQKTGHFGATVLAKTGDLAAKPFHASGTFLQRPHHMPSFHTVPRLGR